MKIVGSIINHGKVYTAGKEELYLKALKGAPIPQHLVDKGIIVLADGEELDSAKGGAGEDEDESDESLPKMSDLKDVLADMQDVDAIKEMQSRDKRKKAKLLYKKRIADLEG